MRRAWLSSGLAIITALSACGGGGGDNTITLTNAGPVFSSTANISIEENAVGIVYTARANDADGDTVTLTLAGGPDAGVVSLDASSGELSFNITLDFENPGDANGDNIYQITLEARDGRGGVANLDLEIEITDQVDVIALRRVGTGFSQALGLVALPDGSGRLLILEKAGRIRVLDPATGAINGVDFLDVSGSVSTANERGLLGLAFSPDFATDRRVYVHFNNLAGDTEIRRYQTFASIPDQADPSTGNAILTIAQPDDNHNAGWIGFDASGLLIIPMGDGGGTGDPNNLAQDPQSLLGKVLRIDPAGDDFPSDSLRDYAIPPGNTFTDPVDGLPEIFAIGLRNPFQSSFDPSTGDLLIGDVGQGAIEEVSRLPMTVNSLNFGWADREGSAFFKGADRAEFTAPVAEYSHGTGPREGRSITGGMVYRGPVEALQDTYIFADFISDNVWGIPAANLINGQTIASSDFILLNDDFVPDQGSLSSITAFGEDTDRNLYLVAFGGDVFRLEALN